MAESKTRKNHNNNQRRRDRSDAAERWDIVRQAPLAGKSAADRFLANARQTILNRIIPEPYSFGVVVFTFEDRPEMETVVSRIDGWWYAEDVNPVDQFLRYRGTHSMARVVAGIETEDDTWDAWAIGSYDDEVFQIPADMLRELFVEGHDGMRFLDYDDLAAS